MFTQNQICDYKYISKDGEMLLAFVTFFHMRLYGSGSARGVWLAFKPSKWHILSYATTTSAHLFGGTLCSVSYSHFKTMTKTWEGDSDLCVVVQSKLDIVIRYDYCIIDHDNLEYWCPQINVAT